MKNAKWKMKNWMPLLLIGVCLVLMSTTGCLSLGSSSTSTTPPNVSRMEIWVHNVEGTNPVFEVSESVQVAGGTLGNGDVELQDVQQLIQVLSGAYNEIPADQREAVLSGLLKVVAALAVK